MKKILILLASFLLQCFAQAQEGALFSTPVSLPVSTQEFTQQKCASYLKHSGDILIQRSWDESKRNCTLSLHPMDVTDLKYRDYSFSNEGLFMVFNSYGDGSTSSSTGSRSFFLFPQIYDYPDFSIEDNGDVTVRAVSGHLFVFDSKKMALKIFSPGAFTEKPLSKNNKGGVELKPSSGYWLDAGWKMGGMAIDTSSSKTTIYGSKSGMCSLLNKELYAYNQGYEHPLLKERQELDLFLQKRCNIQF